MRLLVSAFLLVLSMPSASQGASPRAAQADSLLEVVVQTVEYDRFLNRTFQGDIMVPGGTPNAAGIVRAWEELFTPQWYASQVRRQALANMTADDLRALLSWLEDPVVRRAISHDYAAVEAEDEAAWARLAEARASGTLDPDFEAAIARIVEVTDGGEAMLEHEIDVIEVFSLYALASSPAAERPTTEDVEQFRRMARREMRAHFAETMFGIVAFRFETFPVEDLAHYAEALDSPEGRTYLKLVLDAPYAANIEAIRTVLSKARK